MNRLIPIEFFLLLGAILFSIGAYGVVTKSNAIIVLMCIELMLNAANINFVAFGAFHPDIMGQAFVIVTITVAAAEVAVGIAILLNAYKMRKTTELDEDGLTSMRW